MENETIDVTKLTTPESSCNADERTPFQTTDTTLIEEDTDTDSNVEELARVSW